jgi:hypothetical protein
MGGNIKHGICKKEQRENPFLSKDEGPNKRSERDEWNPIEISLEIAVVLNETSKTRKLTGSVLEPNDGWMYSVMTDKHSRTLTIAEKHLQTRNTPKTENGALNLDRNKTRAQTKITQTSWWFDDWDAGLARVQGQPGRVCTVKNLENFAPKGKITSNQLRLR